MRYYFSTDDIEPTGRFEQFRDTIRNLFQRELTCSNPDAYFGTTDLDVGGPSVFGRVMGAAAAFVRTPDFTKQSEEGAWLLMTRSGLMHVRQDDVECDLKPGEGIIFNTIKPHLGWCAVPSDTWIVHVADPVLRAMGATDAANRTRVLKKDSPLAGLMSGVLEAIEAQKDAPPQVSQATSQYLADLIALAIGSSAEGQDLAETRGLKAARLRAVLDDIRQHFRDAKLDAADVAARLGITPRYVHLLLEETGRTFSEHVLEQRLEFARRLLRDPMRTTQRIADIAYTCGFTDLSYFNRTYRRRFDETPSDTRG